MRWLIWWANSLGKKLLKQPRDSHLPPLSVNKDNMEVTLTFLLTHQVSMKIFTILQHGVFAFLFVQPKAGNSGHFQSCQEILLKPPSSCNECKGCWSLGPAFGAHVGAAQAGGDGSIAALGKEATQGGLCPEKGGPAWARWQSVVYNTFTLLSCDRQTNLCFSQVGSM